MFTHLSLQFILPSMVAHCPVLDGWLDIRLPLYWLRKGGSSNNITYLLWPDLFLSLTICLSSLILVYPQALCRPKVRPTAHDPISLSGPFIPIIAPRNPVLSFTREKNGVSTLCYCTSHTHDVSTRVGVFSPAISTLLTLQHLLCTAPCPLCSMMWWKSYGEDFL